MLSVFYTVGYAILYRARADAGRFLYGWMRDPLLCYPPLHYCWGRCCSFFIRLAAQPSTVLPPPTLVLGQMLPDFMRLAVRSSTVLPPHTLLLGPMLPVFLRLAVRPFTVLPLYTAPRFNAAWFGAMTVGVLGDPCAAPLYCT